MQTLMKWQPTPVFFLGELHGQSSLAGYSPWDHKGVGHNLVTKQQQFSKYISCICIYYLRNTIYLEYSGQFYLYIYIHTHIHTYEVIYICIQEGDGTPLQYSCLENPMDGGAW